MDLNGHVVRTLLGWLMIVPLFLFLGLFENSLSTVGYIVSNNTMIMNWVGYRKKRFSPGLSN